MSEVVPYLVIHRRRDDVLQANVLGVRPQILHLDHSAGSKQGMAQIAASSHIEGRPSLVSSGLPKTKGGARDRGRSLKRDPIERDASGAQDRIIT